MNFVLNNVLGKHATYADAVLMAAVEFVIDLFGKDTLQEYRHLSEVRIGGYANCLLP